MSSSYRIGTGVSRRWDEDFCRERPRPTPRLWPPGKKNGACSCPPGGSIYLSRPGSILLSAIAEGLRVARLAGQRAQCPRHQLREHLPGQPRPSVGARTVVERVLEQHRQVLRQGAGGVHDMKHQARQQRGQGDPRLASAPLWYGGQLLRCDEFIERAQKAVRRLGTPPRVAMTLVVTTFAGPF